MSVLRFLMRITDDGEWITRLSSDFLMRGLVFPVRVSDFFQTSRYGYLSVGGLIYTTGRVMSDGLVLRDADELSGLCVFFGFSAVVCYLLSLVGCFSVLCRLFGFCGLFSGLSCGFLLPYSVLFCCMRRRCRCGSALRHVNVVLFSI